VFLEHRASSFLRSWTRTRLVDRSAVSEDLKLRMTTDPGMMRDEASRSASEWRSLSSLARCYRSVYFALLPFDFDTGYFSRFT
jgi:hypothetical protein